MGSRAMLRIRTARELWLFLPARHRVESTQLPHDGTASLGHVVESLGVPLTEVGTLLADGVAVEPSYRPRPGDTIDVGPVPRPQRVAGRFVLDVHLGTLARYLRLLGVDTAYRNDSSDDELIAQSRREDRVLLTQDRGLLRRRALRAGAYVHGAQPFEQLTDVLERFAPPLRPWSRCTSCNGELGDVPQQEVQEELREGTRRNYRVFARCRSCHRVYWRGAHARRIEAIIDAAYRAHPGDEPRP